MSPLKHFSEVGPYETLLAPLTPFTYGSPLGLAQKWNSLLQFAAPEHERLTPLALVTALSINHSCSPKFCTAATLLIKAGACPFEFFWDERSWQSALGIALLGKVHSTAFWVLLALSTTPSFDLHMPPLHSGS